MTGAPKWFRTLSPLAVGASILLLAALLIGLGRLNHVRARYSTMHDAAAELDTTAAELAALQWEVMAEGDAESDEIMEGQSLVAAGDRHIAMIATSHRPIAPDELRAVWNEYHAATMQLIQLVVVGDVRGVALIVMTFAALAAVLTFAQRRRRSSALAEVLQRAEVALRHQATHDALTGLPNRTQFAEDIAEQASVRGQSPQRFAVLVLDLDRFKEVNDTLGHETGDALLQAVAARLRKAVRQGDVVARLGGDEFALLLRNTQDGEVATVVAEGILAALAEPLNVAGVSIAVEASIGIAHYPTHTDDPTLLLHRADVAMYEAKVRRNAFAVYHPADDNRDRTKLTLLSDLRDALASGDGQLSLAYQPQVVPVTGSIRAVEALARWSHPTRGVVPPSHFIPLAEQTSLIDTLTIFVIDRALAQLAAWDRQGLHLSVAVNVSVRTLMDERLPSKVTDLLQEHGVSANRLEIEITETSIMPDLGRAARVLQRLAVLGIQIAIDDYGTGYSSLSLLRELPVTVIKIDRSLVRAMSESRSDRAIVASTMDLARHLGLQVVAEGVETAHELEMLTSHGCDAVQGYLFGRPVAPGEVPELLRAIGAPLRVPAHA